MVVDWDQTGIHYVLVSGWTVAKSGLQRVEIAVTHDRRQNTAVFGGTTTGDFLPILDECKTLWGRARVCRGMLGIILVEIAGNG